MPQNKRSSVSRTSSIPEVPRPAPKVWQSLESERIRWEGQVLIVGQESDLPALLVITGKRLALVANNEIALEFPLAWMRPEPKLVAENGVRLYISPDGDSQIAQPMLLRVRAGRAAAVEIAAVLTGRTFSSRSDNSPMHIPAWKDQVGASASVALPQLEDDATSRKPKQKAAWPPAESSGINASNKPHTNKGDAPRPSANIAPWRIGGSAPEPRPVPTGTSRAARLLGTSEDGYTVSESAKDAPKSPAVPQNGRKNRMPMWFLNLAVVAMLVAGFGYVAADRGYGFDDMRALVPGNVAGYLGIDKPVDNGDIALAPEPLTPEAGEPTIQEGGDNRVLPVTNTNPDPTEEPVVEEETEEPVVAVEEDAYDSVGSSGGRLPVTESAGSTPEATEEATEEAPVETEAVTEEPIETEEPVATEVATEAPVETPEPTETEVATEAPVETPEPTETEVATEAPVETEAAEPIEEATETPDAVEEDEGDQTIDPTIDPTLEEPAGEDVTPEPTVAPTQTVTIEQPASVAEDTVPNQQFQQGGIRYSIDAVATGASIDELPEVNTINGTWVVITLTGSNASDADQTLDMSEFTLLADGEAIPLDSGTGWVNSLLDNDPAYGPSDTATWVPGEQHRFSLTFRAPADVSSLVLVAGDQQIALDPAITSSVGLNEAPADQAPAATLSGTVTEVIDGQTIVVDIDGQAVTVRYLGIDAPTGEACYAEEATQINAELVEGQTVTLERQSVDTNARGVWVRDVWVTDAEGNQVLVSQALVSQGAAASKVSEPNSRYAGWLNSTEQEAQNNDTGLWSTCGAD